jgi:DNA-binding MarR family transcriptional regulator
MTPATGRPRRRPARRPDPERIVSGRGRDHIDRILKQWRRERPDWDVVPLGVIGSLLHLSRHLERQIETRLDRFRIGIEAFDVLATLRRSGPPFRLTPSQLFRSLVLSSGTMTNRVDRLEAAGLVVRTPDPKDRRSVLVGLTPPGRELIEAAFASHLQNLRLLLRGLDHTERSTLRRLLRKLLTTFESADTTNGARRETARTARSGRDGSGG